MSTDPMRNALERIAEGTRFGGQYSAKTAQNIAREALAAHPDDQHVRVPREHINALICGAMPVPDLHYEDAASVATALDYLRAALAANQPPQETT